MNLKQQVCSIGYSTKLKELGVKQISLFYYCRRLTGRHNETEIKLLINKETTIDELYKCSAFTVAELGLLLPNWFESCKKAENEWSIKCYWVKDNNSNRKVIFSNTEANARAEMLIYLIENNLVKVEDLDRK